MKTSRDTDRTDARVAINLPPVVSPQEWQFAHQKMLEKEKAVTRARDALVS